MGMKMRKIKNMIEEAPEASAARAILDAWQIFGNITEEEYKKGRELIREEFKK